MATNLKERVATIRKFTDLPVVVGFGISTPEQVKEVSACADGVVVGSALVNCISDHLGDPAQITLNIGSRAKELTSGLS